MGDKNGIAQVEKPIQLAWRNRRVRMKETTKGEIFYLLELELDEESWAFLKTMPRNAEGEMVIWMTEIGMVEEIAPKEKKPKEPKGPWGKFWRELFLAGFVNCPGVKEAVEGIRETPYEDAWKDLLHRFFGVGGTSLAVVGPEEIFAKFPPDQFPQVQAMVEQAIKKSGGRQG